MHIIATRIACFQKNPEKHCCAQHKVWTPAESRTVASQRVTRHVRGMWARSLYKPQCWCMTDYRGSPSSSDQPAKSATPVER